MSDSEQQGSSQQRQSTKTHGRNWSNRSSLYAQSSSDTPYRGARRKRSLTKRVRRFESALSNLDLPVRMDGARQTVGVLYGSGWQRSKALSGLLLLVVAAALFLLHSEDAWFVYSETVRFENLTYLKQKELYEQIQVDGWNIFWIKPQVLSERLMRNPYIDQARVKLKLPSTIEVAVEEVQPVAMWITTSGVHWLAPDGMTLPVDRKTDDKLPQIVDSQLEARAIGEPSVLTMEPQILASALALMEALPDLGNTVRYNRSVGLNFQLPGRSVWVYWGDGENLQTKLTNLEAVGTVLADDEVSAQIIDVRYVNQPYFR